MQQNDLTRIQNTIDYEFKNQDLLQQAFIRRSFSSENGGQNNEILEFIGDKVLDLIVIKVFMDHFGKIEKSAQFKQFSSIYNEGQFTNMKKDLVESKMLSYCIDKLGFQDYLLLGKGEKNNRVWEQQSVKEALFEAIIGAVALDSNWNINKLENTIRLMLDIDGYLNNTNETDYIKEVQTWCQCNTNCFPDYSYQEHVATIIDPFKGFICQLTIDELQPFIGKGKSKSIARKDAAKKAFTYLYNNKLISTIWDEIGEPNKEKSINQLQELFQKGYINEPIYVYKEIIDSQGNPNWMVTCTIKDIKKASSTSNTKKEAKKNSALKMLQHLYNIID